MTDSRSILTTLTRDTEERISVKRHELQMLQAGQMRVSVLDGGGERDVSSDWITRLGEWIASDEALLARLEKGLV